MIQRIQTIYLLLALCCAVLLYFVPVWQSNDASTGTMDAIGAGTHFFLLPVPAIIILSHIVTIFLFKKRKSQMRWCDLNSALFILFFVWAFINIQMEHNFFQHFDLTELKLGTVLPVAGVILNLLARGRIGKDEDLIRSMDRLR